MLNGPPSGYESRPLVDNLGPLFWAASYGQIYPELKRLSAAGLVEGADQPTGGPQTAPSTRSPPTARRR